MTANPTQQINLVHLKCGDQDNNVWYGSYSEHPDDAEAVLQLLTTANNSTDEIESIIFDGDISADNYRQILKILTLYDEYGKRTSNDNMSVRKANILFFATLVNYHGTALKNNVKIKSYQAAREAASSANVEGRELDYRDYIISGNTTNWNNEYKTIITDNNEYSTKIQLQLPVVNLRLGLWRFATDRIPGIMELVSDSDNTKYVIPASVWMNFVADAISNRITTKFSKFEEKSLHKMIKIDANTIDDILAQNNFKSVIHFPNAYKISINENSKLVVHNTNEPPDISNASGFVWTKVGSSDWVLNCNDFYLVKMIGNTIHVLQLR